MNASTRKPLCIITARGGSKRIPRKNLKDFLGSPIIRYPIESALQSSLFETVMVSTEDPEIAEVARSYGAEVPFMRSEATANDSAILADVAEEVLREYEERGQRFEFFCLMLPTAVFISPDRLQDAYRRLAASDADGLIPVVRYSDPIQRAFTIKDGGLQMLWPEYMHVMSQDIPPSFHDAGQFWWMRVQSFNEQRKLYGNQSIPLEVPESEAQDIDTLEDWKLAEIKYQLFRQKEPQR